jgi:hypothetical protein
VSGLGRHGPTKARRGLGLDWTTIFALRTVTEWPKKILGFPDPNPFGTKHDGLGPGWPGTATKKIEVRAAIKRDGAVWCMV